MPTHSIAPHLTYLQYVKDDTFTTLLNRVSQKHNSRNSTAKQRTARRISNNFNVHLQKLSKKHGGHIPRPIHLLMPTYKRKHINYPLRIGTDCSGIEAPVMALQLLEVPHRHIFSTEIDARARESIRANYSPLLEYDDIFKRNVRSIPDIDVYVCGFPCQSFSIINANGPRGFYQEHNKGIIFFQCYNVICRKQPCIFILENIKSLLSHDNGNTFKVIQSYLNTLSQLYIIQHKVLNAKDFDGNLQNRPRVYIVGVRKDYLPPRILQKGVHVDLFPVGHSFNVPISKVLLNETELPDSYNTLPLTEHKQQLLQQLVTKGIDLNDDYIVNLNISGVDMFQVCAMQDRCPCLLANCSPFYITSKKRCLSAREALRIQGFPDDFKQVVSERQLLKQCGNSMSIAVLTALFKHILMLTLGK